MKYAKKLASFLLALVMVLSLGITAFAAPETGSLTINGALKGNSFTLYKIFDLESYNDTTKSYQYTIKTDNPLYNTVKDMKLQVGSMTAEELVFTLTPKTGSTDTFYVELATNFKNAPNDGVTVKAIASNLKAAIKALSDADKNKLLVAKVEKLDVTSGTTDITVEQATGAGNEDKCNVTFSNLALGYYLVDSSAGAMIGLTTTAPDAVITAKNKLPGAIKEVKRNVDNEWGEANSKEIGETIEYRVQVSVEEGAMNYVIYDSMSEGVTFDKITKVYYGDSSNPRDEHIVYDRRDVKDADGNITGTKSKGKLTDFCTFTENVTYTAKDNTTKTCRFKIDFEDDFLQTVLNDIHKDDTGYNKVIYVEYTAKLNENAVVGAAPASTGNPNDIYLTYGDNNVEVTHDTVTTYTYQMELVKYKEDKTVLAGAQFEVYDTRDDANNSRNPILFVKEAEKKAGKTVYRVAASGETTNTTTTIEAGDVIIEGLGGSFKTGVSEGGRSYFFKEIKAPEGYTLLPAPVEFHIKNKDEMATFEVDGKYKENGLGVENKSGSVLPSTGGIGTTIFYVAGSVLLVGAAVLLITKKRMSVER